MTRESVTQKTEQLMALVTVLTAERDEALRQLALARAERDHAGAMLVQVEASVAETLHIAELSPQPTDRELARELDDCRRALKAMQIELDQAREDLARAEFKVRTQAAKLRRQPPAGGGE